MKNISVILCFSLLCFKIQSQDVAEDKLGAWYMYNGSHKLSEKYALKTMAHFRYFELTSEIQQEIYRLGVNYTFSPKTNLTLGYSFVNTDTSYQLASSDVNEHRIYEDLNISHKMNSFKFKHRFRLEHRFFDKSTSNWLRYDLNVGYPISEKWNIYTFNELFLHLDRGKRFAQNWTGAGFLHQLSQQVKLKIGYFQIKLPSSTLKRLQLGIILNTNHIKKTK